jgi:hypothetical protein
MKSRTLYIISEIESDRPMKDIKADAQLVLGNIFKAKGTVVRVAQPPKAKKKK